MMMKTNFPGRIYNSRKRIFVPMLSIAGMMLLSGCHKKPQTAYAPPPPPITPRTTQHTQHPNAVQTPSLAQKYPVPDANAPALATEEGMASWYGTSGRAAATGEKYTAQEMTAANRTLPLNTMLRVTNIATGQAAIVRVNDRGPFVHGRIIDLSMAAAKATGIYQRGMAKVKIEVLRWPDNALKPGHWCVQIGAFEREKNAMQLKQQLLSSYAASTVIEFAGDTGYWVRYKSQQLDRDNAIQVASSIRTSEPTVDAFLVRLD
jgi:rare lipoprotein A